MLVDTNVLQIIVDSADITKKEVVYEIGTGNGVLTDELCKRAGRVISCEIDKSIIPKELEKYENLTLLYGDGFTFNGSFDVFVSNLPYSKSRKAIEWLATKKFDRGVIMVQKEFANKILAKRGSNYRAISALAQYCFDIDIIGNVNRNAFQPRPRVDSVLLKIIPQHNVSEGIIKALKLLFAYRGKKVRNVIKKFKIENIDLQRRVEQLTPEEAIEMASMIERKQLLQTLR